MDGRRCRHETGRWGAGSAVAGVRHCTTQLSNVTNSAKAVAEQSSWPRCRPPCRVVAAVGELSRMLPSEMALLAHGWPRRVADNPEGAAAAAAAGGQLVSLSSLGSQDEDGQIIEEQYYLPGERARAGLATGWVQSKSASPSWVLGGHARCGLQDVARCGLGVLGRLWVACLPAWRKHTSLRCTRLDIYMCHDRDLGQGMVAYGRMGPLGSVVYLSAAHSARNAIVAVGDPLPSTCLPPYVGHPLAVHVQAPMQHACCTGCAVLSACCCHTSAVAGWMTHPADSRGGRCVLAVLVWHGHCLGKCILGCPANTHVSLWNCHNCRQFIDMLTSARRMACCVLMALVGPGNADDIHQYVTISWLCAERSHLSQHHKTTCLTHIAVG